MTPSICVAQTQMGIPGRPSSSHCEGLPAEPVVEILKKREEMCPCKYREGAAISLEPGALNEPNAPSIGMIVGKGSSSTFVGRKETYVAQAQNPRLHGFFPGHTRLFERKK